MTTIVTYTATGGQTDFVLPFDYLSSTHLRAYVDGVSASFTVPSTSTLRLDTALGGGETVILFRQTPVTKAELLVDFAAGARLQESDLDTAVRQIAYAMEEMQERAVWAQSNTDSGLDPADAGNRKIENLANPTAPNDAVTKLYADSLMLSGIGLPDPSGSPDGYGLYVVSGAWTIASPTTIATALSVYTKAEADARYLQQSNSLSELERDSTVRETIQAADARVIISPTMNNPGVVDLLLDPGGNWWENSSTIVPILNGSYQLFREERKRATSSVARTSGTVNVDDFIGLVANRNARVVPGTVTGQWEELSTGTVQTYSDDGAGNITGTGLDAASSIDYETGQITLRASGVENVEDGTITANFTELSADIDSGYGDVAANRIYLGPGTWLFKVHMTVRELLSADRTIKAALTDEVSSPSTTVYRNLWRTGARPIDVKADESVGLSYHWPVTLAAAGFLCFRAVASTAAAVTFDSLNVEVEQLSY